MTTRKEDAASIVGEELAEELDGKEKVMVGKSEAEVIKAEETPPIELSVEPVEKMTDDDHQYRPFGGAMTMEDAKSYITTRKEEQRIGDLWYALQCVMSNIASDPEITDKGKALSKAVGEFQEMVKDKNAAIFESLSTLSFADAPAPAESVMTHIERMEETLRSLAEKISTPAPANVEPPKPPHMLDSVLTQLRSDFDSILLTDAPLDERLRQIQGSFNQVGVEIQRLLSENEPPAPKAEVALAAVVQRLSDKIDLLMSQQPRQPLAPAPHAIPSPRSIHPASVPQQTQQPQQARTSSGFRSLRSIVEESVGLE